MLKSIFLILPLKALQSLGPNYFKSHFPPLQSTVLIFYPKCSAHSYPNCLAFPSFRALLKFPLPKMPLFLKALSRLS